MDGRTDYTTFPTDRTAEFFTKRLTATDNAVAGAIMRELTRQKDEIELVASENIVSRAVLDAAGSVLTNKYAEGYPGRRYYDDCQYVDIVEDLAIERARKLVSCAYANVQPNSGIEANQAVMLALIKPGDTILKESGFDSVSGGTDTHLVLVDLRPKGLKGSLAEQPMGRADFTCNKNGVPFDPEKPTVTSGVRLGTPAGTTRGFGPGEFAHIGCMIATVLDGVAANGPEANGALEAAVKAEVIDLCRRFPIYTDL
jgi:glycine/serine hydroxymethyltransferase